MSYFSDGSMVPTGWTATSDDKHYPRLETRLPVAALPTPSSWSRDAASDNDSSPEEVPADSVAHLTRMADESSDDDLPNGLSMVCSVANSVVPSLVLFFFSPFFSSVFSS